MIIARWTHGVYGYLRKRCRCGRCRAAYSTCRARSRERAAARLATGQEITHGLTGYNYYGCRCSICGAARRAANRGTS